MVFRIRGNTWGRLSVHAWPGVALLLGLPLVPSPSPAQARERTGQNESAGACTQVALSAFRSCGFEVQADYWLALARCDNLKGTPQRSACREAAGVERTEQRKLCAEQWDEREDVCDGLGDEPYAPRIDPAAFVAQVTNPYFPLTPGTTLVYEGQTAEGLEHVEVQVTGDTKEILGVTCIVVRDTVQLAGEVVEDTLDYFAQDKAGNVWYFGEESKSFEEGELLDLEGSWKAGRDDARPGIIMKAHPKPGDLYRQEFSVSVAEDLAGVLALNETVTIPFGTFAHSLKTKDFTPLEPEVIEHKFYAPGIGLVLTVDLDTGNRVELVEVRTP